MSTPLLMKKELRLRFRKWMNESVTLEYSKSSGERVCEKITKQYFGEFDRPKVSIFISKFPEISTLPLIEHLFASRAEVYIPAWHAEEMWMCKVETQKEFDEICAKAPVGKIPMPTNNRVPIENVTYDFIIIPGLAFDRNCHRLGYGYGHYDYFLSRYFAAHPEATTILSTLEYENLFHFILVGLGYDGQIYEQSLPFEEHDIQLHVIVTPNQTITNQQ